MTEELIQDLNAYPDMEMEWRYVRMVSFDPRDSYGSVNVSIHRLYDFADGEFDLGEAITLDCFDSYEDFCEEMKLILDDVAMEENIVKHDLCANTLEWRGGTRPYNVEHD